MKVTEIITPNSNQLNEIEFPSFKMPKLRNPFKRGPKDEPQVKVKPEELVASAEQDLFNYTKGMAPSQQKSIQDTIERLSEKWATDAVAAERSGADIPSFDSISRAEGRATQVILSDPQAQQVFEKLAIAKRQVQMAKPVVKTNKPDEQPIDARTKTQTEPAKTTDEPEEQPKNKKNKKDKDKDEDEDPWERSTFLKYLNIVSWVTAVFEVIRNVNNAMARPLADYLARMKEAKELVDANEVPVEMLIYDSGKIADGGDGKGRVQHTPLEWYVYYNRTQFKAAWVKFLQIEGTSVFKADIVFKAVRNQFPDAPKLLIWLGESILGLSALGYLSKRLARLNAIKWMIARLSIAGGLYLINDFAKEESDNLHNEMPANWISALLSWDFINSGMIKAADAQLWGMTYFPNIVDEVQGRIDWFNDVKRKVERDEEEARKQASNPQASQTPIDDTSTASEAEPGSAAPRVGPGTTNPSGYPNMIPNNNESVDRSRWVRNYDGTRVKNPRTNIWESYKR